MGKVQDTINRIARRYRHNATQAIALIVPTQKKPTRQSFPTAYNAVTSWLATQTSAPYRIQLDGLTRALQHSNRLENAATERLKIVTLFKTQIDAMMPSLKQQFIDSGIPYDDEGNQSYECTKTLLQELAYGYKIALVDVLLRRSGLHRKDRIHAIYFAMHCLAELGLRYSQSYRKWPTKCWRDINTLYWLAEQENAVNEAISTTAKTPEIFPTTIGGLYVTVSLFHLSNSNHLRASDMEKLIVELSHHATLVSLQKSASDEATSKLHSVALNSDAAPTLHRYCNYADEDKIRYMSITPVTEALLQKRVITSKAAMLSRTQMQTVIQTLGHQRQRRTARAIASATVSIQVGLKDCHASMQQHMQSQTVPASNWSLKNSSDLGLGLYCSGVSGQPLRAGDLVTCRMREPGVSKSCSGLIRWLKVEPLNEIHMGIELLGQNVRPVLCQKRSGNNKAWEPSVEALTFEVGYAEHLTEVIALPETCYRLGDTVNIYSGFAQENATQFKLAELLDYNARIEFYKLVSVSADQNAELNAISET